jgi:hypothetical protein
MDLGDVIRLLAGSAVVAAIVSGVIAEWRTRQAEKRAVHREEAAEKRAEERERRRDHRDLLLRQIDDTQGDYLGSMDWLMFRAMGSQEHMDKTRWGHDHFPNMQWYLIGDEGLLDQVFGLRIELGKREHGAGFSQHDVARMGGLQGHVLARLESQRERIRNGDEPVWPSARWVKSMLDRAGAEFGIPQEYQPKVKDD